LLQNPFFYGVPVTGQAFINRKDEIQELVNNLSTGQNVIIFSPRKYGKTSLILQVLEKLKKKGIITFYLDLFPISSRQEFITSYAKAIAKIYPKPIQNAIKQIKKILPRIIPKIVFKKDDMPDVEISYDLREDDIPLIEDLFEAVNKEAENKKRYACVVFDEFQEITIWDKNREIEKKMRSIFQFHKNVAYVFMGSKRHILNEIFHSKNRPFYLFGKYFPLNKIKEDEFIEFIKDRFNKGGFKISEDLPIRILQSTDVHPHYTQLLCNILWDKFYDTKEIDVEEGIKEIIRRQAYLYNQLWDNLAKKPIAKVLLKELANNPEMCVYSAEFISRHKLPQTTIRNAIKYLEEEEIIEKENNKYVFIDVFFRLWIKDFMEEENVKAIWY
jgi:hypothetical protein